jgi:hypothetical protein
MTCATGLPAWIGLSRFHAQLARKVDRVHLVRKSYRAYCDSNPLEVACPAFITLILAILIP